MICPTSSPRLRVEADGRVVKYPDSHSLCQNPLCFFRRNRRTEFYVDCLAVPKPNRNPDTGSRNSYFFNMHYLARFFRHPLFFYSVSTIQEDTDLWQYIEGYLVRIDVRTNTASFQNKPRLIGHFFQSSTATTRYRLVGAHHNSPYGIDLVQRIKRDHHLDCGAIRTGNYPLMPFYIPRIDLWNHQGHRRVHPKSASIINGHCSGFRSQRR